MTELPLRPMHTSLDGKVALVTGGARRVGRVISLALAMRGAHVAFTHICEECADPTVEEIESLRVSALAIPMDICEKDAPRCTVDAVLERFGRLDILVNNASVWLKAPFTDITAEDWQRCIDINLTGPFLMSQAAARPMLEQKSGLVINITDLSAYQTWPGYAHHAASKAGLVALTRVMAAELAPHIRVNAIAPGTVLLPDGATDAKIEWAVGNSLLKRTGCPEDVARTVLYLVDSDFATGGVYFIDGGRALL